MDINEVKYVGWHRPGPGRPWQRVVAAATEEQCLDLVTARVDSGDVKVLPEGQHPLGSAGGAQRTR